ncbi:PapB/FocB family fimbrial expression transcriptional regulator [Yersinia kristensenii]
MTDSAKVAHIQKRNNLLVAGNISDEQFELLVELSSIHSKKMIQASLILL